MESMRAQDDGEIVIENAIRAAYPEADPRPFGGREGQRFQLAGCFAIRIEEPVAHWLIVSRGFTELGEKEEADPNVSGWGFELTCRVPALSEEYDFGWVIDWMQGIADSLAKNGTSLAPYHNMPMTDPRNDDEICALVFVDDVALQPTASQNGKFNFLQMVGLTAGEFDALQGWQARSMVELIRQRNPLFLIGKRESYLRDVEFAQHVAEGRERDGSSMGLLTGVALLWFQEAKELQIHLQDNVVPVFKSAICGRLPHGHRMLFIGDPRRHEDDDGNVSVHAQTTVVLLPEDGPSRMEERGGMKAAVLRLGRPAISQLVDTLAPQPGSYVLPDLPGVRFVVATAERFSDPRYPW
ncbi:suppressor of fused domain protein [Pendulispora brunnea]|uniref:Suppressor of fused domain protein n=1 Tax=Pendulispora brunnea TaxID=2905690 RepID=A0ABZ2K898_9BACT